MRGTRLSLTEAGPDFDFSSPLKDFDCTVQNALVNVATMKGSDPIFADRGTELMKDAASGRIINQIWANQVANFAALTTLAFLQQTEQQGNTYRLRTLSFQVSSLKDQRLELMAGAVSTDGEVRGVVSSI